MCAEANTHRRSVWIRHMLGQKTQLQTILESAEEESNASNTPRREYTDRCLEKISFSQLKRLANVRISRETAAIHSWNYQLNESSLVEMCVILL